MTTLLTDVNLSILADTDCPSDWEREDLLQFAQEAARAILALREAVNKADVYIDSLEMGKERRGDNWSAAEKCNDYQTVRGALSK